MLRPGTRIAGRTTTFAYNADGKLVMLTIAISDQTRSLRGMMTVSTVGGHDRPLAVQKCRTTIPEEAVVEFVTPRNVRDRAWQKGLQARAMGGES